MMKPILRFSDSPARIPDLEARGSRKGFGLVEVIVAMLVLAIAVSALASLSLSVSQSSMKVTGSAYRNGVVMHEVNRLETLPYDSLPVGAATFIVSGAPYPHTRVVTIAEPVANLKTVKVVITPVNAKYKPDTVKFTRTRARTTRALNTTMP